MRKDALSRFYEGETTVYPLFSAMLKGESYTAVPGLAYRDGKGEILCNENPGMTPDLDALPFVDYDFISLQAVENSLRKENGKLNVSMKSL